MAENILYDRQETSSEDSEAGEWNRQRRIIEEEINEERKIGMLCEVCVREDPFMSIILFMIKRQSVPERWFEELLAVYLCFDCVMYVCRNCLSGHRSHRGMEVGRKENETEIARLLLDDVMKESKTERMEKFENSQVRIYDRVNVKHEFDRLDCSIHGLCILENTGWVACDRTNCCIKIFSLGSNVLQRYIRVGGPLGPGDVTEILVNQNSTEPNLESGSRSEVSVTARAEQDKQCLVAVTLPWEHQIVFIDLSKKPALLHKVIRTEEQCWAIKFYYGKIFTVGVEHRDDAPVSVYIKSTDGVTLRKFDTGIYGYFPDPFLAVVSGRVYLTDGYNSKVQCRSVEGQLIKEITIEGSCPVGISVDPDNNVYVCAWGHKQVYKLDADLTRDNLMLDQTADYMEIPLALCYYRDKLFVSHDGTQSLYNHVTVVGLL